MDKKAVEALLDALAESEALRDKLRLDRAKAEDVVMEPVRRALEDIEAEYKPNEDLVEQTIADLKKQIMEATVKLGETVKGAHKVAVFYSGRITWDTKPLEGLAAVHPELNRFKRVGEPYAVVQNAKGGE